MDKEKSIQRLKEQLEAIDEVKSSSFDAPEFKKWRRGTRIVIERVFGERSKQILESQNITFFCGVAYPGMPDDADEEAFQSGVTSAKALLESMIQEVEEFGASAESSGSQLEAPERVTLVWLRQHAPVRLWLTAVSILFAAFIGDLRALER